MRQCPPAELGGLYAYAGREWVVERLRRIIGGKQATGHLPDLQFPATD
jgi:hypothetical protein